MLNKKSNLNDIELLDSKKQPEHASTKKAPHNNFVISRDLDANALSRFGDEIWDLTPYSLNSTNSTLIIRFHYYPEYQRIDAKLLLFRTLYFGRSYRNSYPSAESIWRFNNILRKISEFAAKRELLPSQVIANRSLFIKLLRQDFTKADQLSAFIQYLYNIEEPFWKITGLTNEMAALARLKATKEPRKVSQTPVIPQRILSELISSLEYFINDAFLNCSGLEKIISKISKCKYYGRSHGAQRTNGKVVSMLSPDFKMATNECELSGYFHRYSITNLRELCHFLDRIKVAVKVQVAIFSGMRLTEVNSLKPNCLSLKKMGPITYYEIFGMHHKSAFEYYEDRWITDKSVSKGIEVCERLSSLAKSLVNFDFEPSLFMTTRPLMYWQMREKNSASLRKSINNFPGFYQEFGPEKFIVNQQDFDELKKIDPFVNWSEKVTVGKPWNFTFPQFRRSLAFYCRQSGLATLPSLQRQLKHLNRPMTLYYGQTIGISEKEKYFEHFSDFMKKLEPEINLVAYINNLTLSDEKLAGVSGQNIPTHDNSKSTILLDSRKKLLKQFKKGMISYSETPLGACLSPLPCSKSLVGNISACLPCKDAVIKPSKLDRAIKRQTAFLEKCARNDFDDFEFRYERSELEKLTQFRNKIKK